MQKRSSNAMPEYIVKTLTLVNLSVSGDTAVWFSYRGHANKLIKGKCKS